MTDERWYVLWVMTGQEREVKRLASAMHGISEALVPTSKLKLRKGGAWHETETLFFPSYVFLRCKMRSDVYCRLKQTNGVIGWLGMDACFPTSVQPEEMSHVLALCRGEPPESVLEQIEYYPRQKRGTGTMMLMGKPQQITFLHEGKAASRAEKQPEVGIVDSSDAQTEGEQMAGPMDGSDPPDGEANATAKID